MELQAQILCGKEEASKTSQPQDSRNSKPPSSDGEEWHLSAHTGGVQKHCTWRYITKEPEIRQHAQKLIATCI